MTNKTREKLREKFENKFTTVMKQRTAVYSDNTTKKLVWNCEPEDAYGWFEKKLTQSNNRILRKWKKAMEKGYTQVEEFTGLKSDFIDFGKMQEEYLKAKGNTVKNNI